MPSIDVRTERETGHGWAYDAAITRDDGRTTEHAVTLSWADHDYWTGGRNAPSETIATLLKYLAEHEQEHAIPTRFDAATARRWFPGVDRAFRASEG